MSSSLDFSRPSPVDGYYDVFLSFRGTDTRKGFTTNLYHALQDNEIHTFMDEDLIGEEIDHLFEVIAKSRMAVVIYSENFAASEWCLRELETIMKHREEKKILVIPIFYKVDLSELKDANGKTGEYLGKHIAAAVYEASTIESWKTAVTKLGGVSGISYKEIEYRSEYEFRKRVIAIIKKKLLTVCLQPTQDEPSVQSSQVEWPSTSSDPLGARSVDVNKKHHRVTVSGYVGEEKLKEVKETGKRAEEKLPYHLVAYPHVAGAYDKKPPGGFIKNAPRAHADFTDPNERLMVLFSDENAQGCAIM